MNQNTISLALILIGGFLIDLGFLYFHASKSFSYTTIIMGAIIFWLGFRRLT